MMARARGLPLVLAWAWSTGADAAAPLKETFRDEPVKRRGMFVSPPAYTSHLPGKYPPGWLDPLADAPSPPSHTYTATDYGQDPQPPYVMLIGPKKRDLAGDSRTVGPDGTWDTWLRFYPRSLEFSLKRGAGSSKWPAVKGFILRTRGVGGMRQWDTLPGSPFPMLQVVSGGRMVNGADGSIAGFRPPDVGPVDLFIGGEGGMLTNRLVPLEFQILTVEGGLKLEVNRHNRTGQLD